MHPQTLRKYERAGLVRPSRSEGMLRLYSEADVRRLRLIKRLVDDFGLNLAGVDLILRMQDRLERLRARLSEKGTSVFDLLDQELEDLLTTHPENEETR